MQRGSCDAINRGCNAYSPAPRLELRQHGQEAQGSRASGSAVYESVFLSFIANAM